MNGSEPTARSAAGHRRDAGFTLIELMIVVTIVAILAALAIPNLLAARMRANESAAVAVLRNVATAQSQFRAAGNADEDLDACGEYGYFGELAGGVTVRGTARYCRQLTGAMSRVDANGEVTKSGYVFRLYLPDGAGAGVREKSGGGQDVGVVDADQSENVWVLYAWPTQYGSTGARTFSMTHRGDIVFTESSAYTLANCAAITPGAALVTGDPANCTALPAIGQNGAHGNPWKICQ